MPRLNLLGETGLVWDIQLFIIPVKAASSWLMQPGSAFVGAMKAVVVCCWCWCRAASAGVSDLFLNHKRECKHEEIAAGFVGFARCCACMGR